MLPIFHKLLLNFLVETLGDKDHLYKFQEISQPLEFVLHVTYGTIRFWDTNTFIRHSVLTSTLTSVLTFSGNSINTITSPRGPKSARKEERKKERKTNYKTCVNIRTFHYNISQNSMGYGVFFLTHS